MMTKLTDMSNITNIEQMSQQAVDEHRCVLAPDPSYQSLLKYCVRKRHVIRPFPHMFVKPEYWNALALDEQYRHILRTLCLEHPDWIICGSSAAVARGLSQSNRLLQPPIHVISTGKHQPRQSHIRFHFRAKPQSQQVDGIRVSSLAEMLLDCALSLSFTDALAIWDATARCYELTPDDMDRTLAMYGAARGIRHARLLMEHVNGLSENAGESLARGVMLQGGLMVPELQVEFRDPISGRRIRVDFLWRLRNGRFIAGELDGRAKYVDPDMLIGGDGIDAVLREKNRDSNLSLLGIHTIHFTFAEIFNGTMMRKLTYASVPCGAPRRSLIWYPPDHPAPDSTFG